MALATQCPHCYTCFRVANDQLKLHAGLVRCGACQRTFNGIEHLLAPGAKPKLPPTIAADLEEQPSTIALPEQATPNQLETAALTINADCADSAVNLADVDQGTTVAMSVTAPVSASVTPSAIHDAKALEADVNLSNNTKPDASASTNADLDFDLDFNDQFEHILEQDIKQEPSTEKTYNIDADIDAWASVGVSELPLEPELEPALEAQHDALTANTSGAANSKADLTTDAKYEAPAELIHDIEDAQDQQESELHEIGEAPHEALNDQPAEDTPAFVMQAERQKKYGRLWRTLLWIFTPLLVLSAFGQTSYLWRNELAAQLPQSKPWLVQACAVLNAITPCRISLPAQIEQILIESNELQTITNQADKPKLFALALQIQNHSSTAQAWPSIELSLNDKKDKAVIRRMFMPNDYLPLKTDPTIISRGFTANGEQNIKLYFELEGVEAAGYHVGTYYP